MGQCSKVRGSVASDRDGKCLLEEDECVSEVLHPLPDAKFHAEFAHCGKQFLAARFIILPRSSHRGVVDRG